MFSRLLAVAGEKMSSHGILEAFDDVEVLFPQADGHPLIQHTMLGPTWMDDLCISITSDTALDLEHKVGLAAGILLETCIILYQKHVSLLLINSGGPNSDHLILKWRPSN